MTPDDESEYDRLPEAFRLALLERARVELGVQARPLTTRQIAEVVGMSKSNVHLRTQAALLRLRRAAEERGL